jgi:hypothetical protein
MQIKDLAVSGPPNLSCADPRSAGILPASVDRVALHLRVAEVYLRLAPLPPSVLPNAVVVADRARAFVFADRVRFAAALRRLKDIGSLRKSAVIRNLRSYFFSTLSQRLCVSALKALSLSCRAPQIPQFPFSQLAPKKCIIMHFPHKIPLSYAL